MTFLPRGRWVALVVLLMILVVAGFGLYRYQDAIRSYFRSDGRAGSPGSFQARALPVRVSPTVRQDWLRTVQTLGTTRARESVTITADVQGLVRTINFQEGMSVDQGQVLVKLDAREEQARLEETRARLEEQLKQYQRFQRLYRQEAVSQAELDARKAAYESVKAEVEAARERLEKFTIRAPFDGVLGLRDVSPGTLVTPGTPITTLDDLSRIKLDFSVPETWLGQIQPGQDVRARTPAFADTLFEGSVRTVDPRVDPITRALQARAEMPNPDGRLKPGILMNVTVVLGERSVLVVPEKSLVILGDRTFVYVIDSEDIARRVDVRVGERRPGAVQVTSGLQEGQTVITEGTLQVRDGTPVQVIETEPPSRTAALLRDGSGGPGP